MAGVWTIGIAIAGFALLGVMLFLFLRRFLQGQSIGSIEERLKETSQQWQGMQSMFSQQLGAFREELNARLHENRQSLENTTKHVHSQVLAVSTKLAELHEGSKRILEVGKDIANLQDILRAPKLRGSLGELFLGDLLAQILPAEHYALQYRFKNGEIVDAVIKLREGRLIPVDAKFTGMVLGEMLAAGTEAEKKRLRREFVQNVKARIDEIASKYILPAEGTLDFALMYIPAENVYYETTVNLAEEGLLSYAFTRRVIPVSPNTFYVYLQTILLGLKGMQIEKSAAMILKHLGQLQGEFEKFDERFRVLGKHLTDAKGSYEDSEERLERFGERLEKVGEDTALPEVDAEKSPTLLT